ncbi:MAG TPA: YtxH domain-containing protein [Candidatus Binatia bacterium]
MTLDNILQSLPTREDIAKAVGMETRNPTADVFSTLGIFGTGVLIGAALALLFAPKPGSEMRRDLSDGMQQFGRQARNAADSASESMGSESSRPSAESQSRSAYMSSGRNV